MKKQISIFAKTLTYSVILFVSATAFKPQEDVKPKSGKIEVPAKGKLSLWEGKHDSFSATITNPNEKVSVELYTVKGSSKKWITPSLLAKKSIKVSVATNGSVLIENYNSSKVILDVKIN